MTILFVLALIAFFFLIFLPGEFTIPGALFEASLLTFVITTVVKGLI